MGPQVQADGALSLEQVNEYLRNGGSDYQIVLPPLPLMEGTTVTECQPDQASLTGRYVERCTRFIREHAGEPFFLYLAHMYVHLPIYVEDRFRQASRNGAYGGAVASIDWATGVIVDELRRLGLSDQTLIVFTSDNGALLPGPDGSGSNAPLRSSKGTTWEGGQRVPCLMSWPGHIEPGTTVSDVASALDLLPTLATIAEASHPADRILDGHDISAFVGLGESRPPADRPFFYIGGGSIEAVRLGRWKLHVRKGADEICELYDLHADIGESSDLAHEHPRIVAELLPLIEAGRADLGDEASGTSGSGVRPIGRVENPVTLTTLDMDDLITIAEYDLPYRG